MRLTGIGSTLVFAVLLVSVAEAHIKVTPVGRMGSNDAVKFIQNNKTNPTTQDNPGPCSTYTTRMATPYKVAPGGQITFTLTETINHPGRFYVQYSPGSGQGFWDAANQLAKVEDTKNGGTTNITVNVPNVTTNTAVIRVLQEMDDQPGEFYVQCLDVNIGPLTAPPPTATPDVSKSGATGASDAPKPGFGGCGTVVAFSNSDRGGGGTGGAPAALAVMLLPLIAALVFRNHHLRYARSERRGRRRSS